MLHFIRILTLATLWPTTLAAQPVFHPNPQSTDIQIDALQANGGVALLGVHRRLEGYRTVAGGVQQVLVDDNGDGSVTVELETPVPLASVWVAVDLSSGLASVAWPEDFEPSYLAEPTLLVDALGDALDGTETATDAVEMTGRLLEVFLVRPGEDGSVWHQTLANGGPLDADSDPASMALGLNDLNPLGNTTSEATPALASLESNDLLILLDPTRLGWQMAPGIALLDGTGVEVAGGAQ